MNTTKLTDDQVSAIWKCVSDAIKSIHFGDYAMHLLALELSKQPMSNNEQWDTTMRTVGVRGLQPEQIQLKALSTLGTSKRYVLEQLSKLDLK